ncbi:hypothetical protein AB0I81_24485 [Nonomuraea sp. NPDC050404]|uniref:hypothetical protein n=1 Tax=Nonomuraea sp. NPDC050404 TaxID=3155783 RepID=UPI00340D93BF
MVELREHGESTCPASAVRVTGHDPAERAGMARQDAARAAALAQEVRNRLYELALGTPAAAPADDGHPVYDARQAAERLARAYLRTAHAHDRVADLHETMAEHGGGRAAHHRERAAWQRWAAERARKAAAASQTKAVMT